MMKLLVLASGAVGKPQRKQNVNRLGFNEKDEDEAMQDKARRKISIEQSLRSFTFAFMEKIYLQ